MRRVVVIGGGISGLAAAHRLETARRAGHPLRVTLVESADRLGGKVVSEHRDGYLVEGGPDAFVPHKPQALELVRQLGLEGRLLGSNDRRRGLAILHRGRLEPVPPGLQRLAPAAWREVAASPLLSWRGKLRFFAERFVPARPSAAGGASGGDDESLASFVRRRLGTEVLERLAEPLLAHIHVGDAERMSLAATYPRLAELERRHGGLARGLAAGGRARARAGADAPPLFWSLHGGMGELVAALAAELETASLLLGRGVRRLRPGRHDGATGAA